MNLAFFHDHKFRFDGKQYYSTGGLSENALARYSALFDNVAVYARVIPMAKDEKLSPITNEHVRIIDYRGADLGREIAKSDFVVARIPSLVGIIAALKAKQLKRKYLLEVVGCPWDALWNHSIRGKILALPMTLLMKLVVRNSPYVVYVTRRFLQKRYPTRGKSVAISNVDISMKDADILEKRLSRIARRESPLIIGTTAALDVAYKGQRYVIEALGKLRRQGIERFKYELVGSGDPAFLQGISGQEGVADLVEIIGPMPHGEVLRWLERVDVYIQPSKQEGLPRALIEAMSRGCLAFGSRTAGIPELLPEKYLFSKGSRKEIARLLKSVSIEEMTDAAKINIDAANQYNRDVLNARRKEFFEQAMYETIGSDAHENGDV